MRHNEKRRARVDAVPCSSGCPREPLHRERGFMRKVQSCTGGLIAAVVLWLPSEGVNAQELGSISFPDIRLRRRPAEIHRRSQRSSQLRVRRGGRSIPSGAAARSELRPGLLGRSDELQPSSVGPARPAGSQESSGAAGAHASGAPRESAYGEGEGLSRSGESAVLRSRRQAGARQCILRRHGAAVRPMA